MARAARRRCATAGRRERSAGREGRRCAPLALREVGAVDEPFAGARAQREPEPGPIGDDDATVAQCEALLEQWVEPVEPLDPAFAGLAGREVDVQLRRE